RKYVEGFELLRKSLRTFHDKLQSTSTSTTSAWYDSKTGNRRVSRAGAPGFSPMRALLAATTVAITTGDAKTSTQSFEEMAEAGFRLATEQEAAPPPVNTTYRAVSASKFTVPMGIATPAAAPRKNSHVYHVDMKLTELGVLNDPDSSLRPGDRVLVKCDH